MKYPLESGRGSPSGRTGLWWQPPSGFDPPYAETTLPHLDTKAGTGPSGSGKNLPGEAGLLPDRAQGLTHEAENPGLQKKKKKFIFLLLNIIRRKTLRGFLTLVHLVDVLKLTGHRLVVSV